MERRESKRNTILISGRRNRSIRLFPHYSGYCYKYVPCLLAAVMRIQIHPFPFPPFKHHAHVPLVPPSRCNRHCRTPANHFLRLRLQWLNLYNQSQSAHYASVISLATRRQLTFQIISAYSSIHRSLEKNPIRATLVIVFVSHVSWSLYASSINLCVSI